MVESPYPADESLMRALQELRPRLPRGGLVHRLDRGTSGLLVVAKTAEAQEALKEAFKRREVHKEYLALVEGRVEGPFEVDAPVRRNREGEAAMRADYRGKEAVTLGEVERSFTATTLLRLRILTGRRHQIRAHLAFIGHPIVGDRDYGGSPGLGRPFLHATVLSFEHPTEKSTLRLESPLPSDLEKYLAGLN